MDDFHFSLANSAVHVLLVHLHLRNGNIYSDPRTRWSTGQSRNNDCNGLYHSRSVTVQFGCSLLLPVQTTHLDSVRLFGHFCSVHHCNGNAGWLSLHRSDGSTTFLDFRKNARFVFIFAMILCSRLQTAHRSNVSFARRFGSETRNWIFYARNGSTPK